MALQSEKDRPGPSRSSDIDTELQEISEIESDLEKIVEKIIYCRKNVSDEVKNKFCSILSSQRPVFPSIGSLSEPGPSVGVDSGIQLEPNSRTEDQEASKKIELLKQKISSNISAMPIAMKRMHDCISRLNKLGSYNRTLDPALKKKRMR